MACRMMSMRVKRRMANNSCTLDDLMMCSINDLNLIALICTKKFNA